MQIRINKHDIQLLKCVYLLSVATKSWFLRYIICASLIYIFFMFQLATDNYSQTHRSYINYIGIPLLS